MDDRRRARLQAGGIDVEEALGRVLGSESLLERLLGKFLEDGSFSALREALAAGDSQAAFSAAHTLKGVAGNLSMTALYGVVSRQVEELRAGRLDAARAAMGSLQDAYDRAAAAIGDRGPA